MAAYHGHKAIVKSLLAANADKNLRNYDGSSALSWSAAKNQRSVVDVLIKTEGVDINCQDKRGSTPLILASMDGHKKVFDVLLLLLW